MDRMAKAGIRFTNAYVTNPVCIPSRNSMMTGMMAGRFGIFDNNMKADISSFVVEHSMGNMMKKAGYDTFYGGKTHLKPELMPLNAGYDEYFKDERDKLSGAVATFMTKKRDKPFFAVASFINPHDICFAYSARDPDLKGMPLVNDLYKQAQALPDHLLPPMPFNSAIPGREPDAIETNLRTKAQAVTPSKFIRKDYNDRDWRIYRWIYHRLTERVDAQIGQVLDVLQENGLEENTLVIFTSDHGDMDGSHRLASKNVFYQESAAVPFIMQYKGVIPGGIVDNKQLVSVGLDILPTIADYAKVSVPDYMLGRSIHPLEKGKEDNSRRPYLVVENDTGRMIRSQRYKYSIFIEGVIRESLIDLKNDPGEMKNLSNSTDQQKILNQHREYMQQWIIESKDTQAKAFAVAPY